MASPEPTLSPPGARSRRRCPNLRQPEHVAGRWPPRPLRRVCVLLAPRPSPRGTRTGPRRRGGRPSCCKAPLAPSRHGGSANTRPRPARPGHAAEAAWDHTGPGSTPHGDGPRRRQEGHRAHQRPNPSPKEADLSRHGHSETACHRRRIHITQVQNFMDAK
jgi:hypothetical protein